MQPVLFAEGPGAAMGRQGSREIVQADQAHRHVAQRHRDPFDVLVGQQLLVGLFVAAECLREAVLAVIDVSDGDLQASQPYLKRLKLVSDPLISE